MIVTHITIIISVRNDWNMLFFPISCSCNLMNVCASVPSSTQLFRPAGYYQATASRWKVKGWAEQLQLLPCLSSRV